MEDSKSYNNFRFFSFTGLSYSSYFCFKGYVYINCWIYGLVWLYLF